MNELKACPRCLKSNLKLDWNDDIKSVRVECLDCGCCFDHWSDTDLQAIEYWNFRTIDPRLKKVVEEMKRLGVRSSEFVWIVNRYFPELEDE